MNTVGLFFGSFNPIHNGHLLIASYLLEKGYCTKVWFIVSPQNPWKEDHSLLDEQQRLEIVRKAIGGDKRMEACDIEFTMPRPSYTYQTLQALKEKYPGEHFALIIGGDNLLRFHQWQNYRQILSEFPILVYPRLGIPVPDKTEPNITVVDAPMSDLSSTLIRQKVAEGKDISSDVPAGAVELIIKTYRFN